LESRGRLKAIGTVAHEWFSAHLALVDNLRTAQKRAMHVWQQEYGTDLGTMLSDTFTTKAFFRDFDVVLASAASGVRHDSGDPIQFGYNVIAHYKKLGIDPRTKLIVFSDSLDIPNTVKIYKEFVGKVGVSFGIGTNLSNDLSSTPLNIVIKLVECNGKPVVKLSDNPTKAIGNPEMIEKVKKAYGVA
jgi:nicotinate phosphoribosyltransferase